MKTFAGAVAACSVIVLGFLVVADRPAKAAGEIPNAESVSGLRVLELFTSEGCSSCPPADYLLTELSGRDDVIALSFHVDYWNRLGWTDPFSTKESTDRQYWYADLFASNQVYTPQVVIGGQQEAVGSRRSDVAGALASVKPAIELRDVEVTKRGATREVVVRTNAPSVNVALVQPRATVDVPRGENGGRTLSHTNVVRDFAVAQTTGGVAKATVSVPSGVEGAFIVAYSQSRSGEIEAAKVVR